MPCIICREDHRPSERVELDDMSAPRREQFAAEYFCNWEFHYVCRSCYWRDGLNRGYFGTFAKAFNLCLDYLALFSIAILVLSSLLRFKVKADYHMGVTVAASIFLVFFCYSRIVKAAVAVVALVSVFMAIFFFGNHSDYFALIPDLNVLTTRARTDVEIKEAEALRKKDPVAYEKRYGKEAPKRPEDPAIAVMRKRDAERKKRLESVLATFRPYIPFKLDMAPPELGLAARAAGWALLVYVVLLWGLRRVVFPALGIGTDRRRLRGAPVRRS